MRAAASAAPGAWPPTTSRPGTAAVGAPSAPAQISGWTRWPGTDHHSPPAARSAWPAARPSDHFGLWTPPACAPGQFSDVHAGRLLLHAGALPGLPRRHLRLRRWHLPALRQHDPRARWSRSSCSASPSRSHAAARRQLHLRRRAARLPVLRRDRDGGGRQIVVSGYACGGPGEPCDAQQPALLPPERQRDARPACARSP